MGLWRREYTGKHGRGSHVAHSGSVAKRSEGRDNLDSFRYNCHTESAHVEYRFPSDPATDAFHNRQFRICMEVNGQRKELERPAWRRQTPGLTLNFLTI